MLRALLINIYMNPVILLIGILIFTYSDAKGQSYTYIGVGGNYYQGELSDGLENAQPEFVIGYQHYFEEHFSFYTSIHIGRVKGEYQPGESFPGLRSDSDVNEYFSSDITGIQAGINWTWLRWNVMHSYVGLGLGVMNFTVEDEEGRNLSEIPDTRKENEQYETRAMYSPIQIGINLFHSKKINILLEQSWNLTNTDYLDNIGYLGKKGSDTIVKRVMKVRYRF